MYKIKNGRKIMYKINKRKYENEFTMASSVDYDKKKGNKKYHNINKLENCSHFFNLSV
jgi:hypothetical protein